jgi:hypothetical protein
VIRRFVFAKFNGSHSTPESRKEAIEATRDELPRIPGVTGVWVGAPCDAGSMAAWDLAIVVEFAQASDVEPYRIHPDHLAYLDQVLKPRVEVKKAWNFGDGPTGEG